MDEERDIETEKERDKMNAFTTYVLANVRVLCVCIIEISMVDCSIERGPIHTLSLHISTLYVRPYLSILVKQHCRNHSNAYRAPNIHNYAHVWLHGITKQFRYVVDTGNLHKSKINTQQSLLLVLLN